MKLILGLICFFAIKNVLNISKVFFSTIWFRNLSKVMSNPKKCHFLFRFFILFFKFVFLLQINKLQQRGKKNLNVRVVATFWFEVLT